MSLKLSSRICMAPTWLPRFWSRRIERVYMMRCVPVALFAIISLYPGASAASDCAEGTTQLSLNECTSTDLAEADGAMNALYTRLMGQLAPKAKASLREAQKAWLLYRDKTCAFEGLGTSGGSMQPMVIGACLTKLTAERTRVLRWHLTCRENDAACTRLLAVS